MANGKDKTATNPNGAGRPSKLTPELQAAIVELVEAGDAAEVAAGVNGIGRSTFFDWMVRGQNGEEPFAEFRTAIARGRDVFESESRKVILDGDSGKTSFGPAKARLEALSRLPTTSARWSQRLRIQVQESDQIKLETLRRVCSNPEVYARVREAENLLPVIVRFCEELSRLDSEGDAGADQEPASPVH